jgi:hypothetical protein
MQSPAWSLVSPMADAPRLWCCIPLTRSQVAACLSREMRSWLLEANECAKCSHHPAQIGDVIFHSAQFWLPCLPLPAHLASFDRTAQSNQRAFTSFDLFVWPATTRAAHDSCSSLCFAADSLIPNLPSKRGTFLLCCAPTTHPRTPTHTHPRLPTLTHDTLTHTHVPTHSRAHAPGSGSSGSPNSSRASSTMSVAPLLDRHSNAARSSFGAAVGLRWWMWKLWWLRWLVGCSWWLQ